jgi:hypothetical protein
MPRICSVCAHPDRAAIDKTIVSAQLPYRRIATQYAVSEQAIRRHRLDHLPSKLADAEAVSRAVEAVDLLTELEALRTKAMSILLQAESCGDFRTALQGIREARACLELLAEVQGELDRRPTLNILAMAPEWLTVRASLMVSLGPYPEARRAVADGLMALEAGS